MEKMNEKKNNVKKKIFDLVNSYYKEFHNTNGFVPGKTKIPYSGRVYDSNEIINLIDSSLDFWLTAGPFAGKLEEKFQKYFNANSFFLVNSGSSANLLITYALLSPRLKNRLSLDDEIITPAVTFPTTVAPIVQFGLVPVFVDCEIGTYNLNPYELEKAITKNVKAIFIPHTLGNPCEMDIIMEIARKYGLFVLEDSCDGLGSKYDGRLVGSFGDIASLSFYPAHHITMGEGGGVIVNNPDFEKVVLSLRDWGRDCWCETGRSNTCGRRFSFQLGDLPFGYDHKYIYSEIGFNFKITDLQAAIGLAQFDKLEKFISKRKENFMKYYTGLMKFKEFIDLPRWSPKADPSWFGFPITVKKGINRNDLICWLEDKKIETRLLFGGNIIRQPGFKNIKCRIHNNLNNSDRVMSDTFFIGVYPGLTEEMIEYVIYVFDGFFRNI